MSPMQTTLQGIALLFPMLPAASVSASPPMIVHTWSGPFTVAADAASSALRNNPRTHTPVLDAVQAGLSACEQSRCDGTVGYGGSPDEACETTLDAMIMAAGTTTNGKAHKVPGRVGDGPIAGSGSYVDGDVGGCGATGDGDIMMRFSPCYQAVESMRRGMSPLEAAEDAVLRMLTKYPDVHAGLVLLNNKGEHAAAASNWQFSYSFRAANMNKTQMVMVDPISAMASASSEL